MPWKRGAVQGPGNGALGRRAVSPAADEERGYGRWLAPSSRPSPRRRPGLRAARVWPDAPGSPGTASAESQPTATAAGRERREVSNEHFGGSSRRSCGPVDLRSMRPGSSAGGRWPGATLRPPDAREAPPIGRARAVEGPARRVPIKRPAQAVMEGGNAYPSCLGQASSIRDTRTACPRLGQATGRLRGFVLASGGDTVPG